MFISNWGLNTGEYWQIDYQKNMDSLICAGSSRNLLSVCFALFYCDVIDVKGK